MCCIFTCCGWMVDLIQRLWTFTMSCFISSAVCCSLVTASMSGVALGYNYSLAEYIDLKETNVSVYLKRGIFDDEIADDMDWRRSGHQPVAGHIGENYLMTGGSDESTTLKSARRLDDSIYESNDRSNFEGSLMRLTAKPIETSPTSLLTEKTSENVFKQYTMGSIDQLKSVQSLINKQKAEAASRRTFKKPQDVDEEQIVIPGKRPIFPYPEGSGRRAMPYSIPPHDPRSTYNSLRAAVPDDTINEPSKWILPKRPPAILPIDVQYAEDYVGLTYPSPVTPRAGPVRPTRPPAFARPRSKPTPTYKIVSTEKRPEVYLPKSIDEDIEAFKKKLMEDKFEPPSIKDKDFFKKMEVGKIKANEDYDDDIKGVPLRKKRNIDAVITPRNNFVDGNDTKVDETTDFVTITTKLVDVNNIDSGRTVDKNTILGSGVNKVSLNSEKSPISIIIKLISSAIS